MIFRIIGTVRYCMRIHHYTRTKMPIFFIFFGPIFVLKCPFFKKNFGPIFVGNSSQLSGNFVGKCREVSAMCLESSGNIGKYFPTFPDEVIFKVPDKGTAEILEAGTCREISPEDFQTQDALFSRIQKKIFVGKTPSVSRQFQRISALV